MQMKHPMVAEAQRGPVRNQQRGACELSTATSGAGRTKHAPLAPQSAHSLFSGRLTSDITSALLRARSSDIVLLHREGHDLSGSEVSLSLSATHYPTAAR